VPLGVFEAREDEWTVTKVAGECDAGHTVNQNETLHLDRFARRVSDCGHLIFRIEQSYLNRTQCAPSIPSSCTSPTRAGELLFCKVSAC
jgi:hypothetical protein